VDAFVRDYLPRAAAVPCPVIVSVAGFSVEDYVAVAAALEASRTPSVSGGPHGAGRAGAGGASGGAGMREPNGPSLTLGVRGVSAVELNVSCPNVKAGCEFVSSPAALKEVVGEVRRVLASLPLLVKLSPLVTDITAVARAAVDAGADALTVSNTIPAMEIDVDTRRPVLANRTGGLSGPGLHPVAVRLVHECWRKVCRDARGPGKHVPIIGAGGVMNWRDAAEFILAGATAVQMGTALFADPRSPLRVVRGLERWVREQGCGSVGELVGAVKD
jgi:dihydroorotate dehydrogenase (NAD+) catalytic subunit